MTEKDIPDQGRSAAAYRALRKKADRIARGEAVGLSEEEQLDLMRLSQELEFTGVELEAQSEELRKLSRELETSKRELWDLYESAPVAYVSLNKKGIVEKDNAAARRMLSGSGRPLVGAAFSNFVMPGGMGNYFRELKNISRSEKPSFFELLLAYRMGKPIYVYCQASAKFDAEGLFSHWHLAFFNVSEQKRLEEELRLNQERLALATNAGKIGIWLADLNTGKSYWNEQLYLMLGLEPREGFEEQNAFFNFIHPQDRQGALKDPQNLLQGGDKIDLEFRIIRADNKHIRWLMARGIVDRDETGRPFQMRGVNFDISDHKQAEEMRRAAQRQLAEQLENSKRVNEELSQYAYAVSHDLKAPLRAIRNYSEFLYEDLAESLSGEQKMYLEGMKVAADQGQRLIDDLLAYSRIGRTSTTAERIDMSAMIKEVKSFLQLSTDIDLTIQKDWPVVETDPMLLMQILKNLVANAIKFNHSASKRIDIGWRQPDENTSIELFVRDNGIGIAPQYQEKIFGIFQRLHTAREFEGTGIGLAVVKKAAQQLGGQVRLESVPGEGSTFYVEIPNT